MILRSPGRLETEDRMKILLRWLVTTGTAMAACGVVGMASAQPLRSPQPGPPAVASPPPGYMYDV
jgi:hypothetical protein